VLADGLDGLAPVGCFADDLDVALGAQKSTDASSVTNTRMDMSVTS
jgi:hypothetical protein